MPKIDRLLLCLLLLLPLLVASRALAAAAPPPPDVDAAAWARALYAAFESKSWGVLVGVVLIGVVYPLRRFGPSVLKTRVGGVALALAISLAGELGVSLAAGVSLTIGIVASALTNAAAAAGVWEWIKDRVPGVAGAAARASTSPTVPAARVVQ